MVRIMTDDALEKAGRIDTSDFPNLYDFDKTMERGLWVLWAVKEKLGYKSLSARQIRYVLTNVKEVSTNERSITQSFNRAGDKIHTKRIDGILHYGIMKSGKDHLLQKGKNGESVEAFYFQPNRSYSSKRILVSNIMTSLNGDLSIVDPYCGERTLDMLLSIGSRNVRILTRLDNLPGRQKSSFLRDFRDFRIEQPNVELRNYTQVDIHDRYIITSTTLVILGHSLKDLGRKESFAIIFSKAKSPDIFEAVKANFNKRWRNSQAI